MNADVARNVDHVTTNRRLSKRLATGGLSTLPNFEFLPNSKAPLLSGRPEKRVTQREISYKERISLMEDPCGISLGIGKIVDISVGDYRHFDSPRSDRNSNST